MIRLLHLKTCTNQIGRFITCLDRFIIGLSNVHVCTCVSACLRVCTWSTDCGLDASLLQNRNSIYSSLDMLRKYVPVQVKQAEGKLIRHLGNIERLGTNPNSKQIKDEKWKQIFCSCKVFGLFLCLHSLFSCPKYELK